MSATLSVSSGTVVDLMSEAVQRFPHRDAYVELDRRMTYAELDRAADGVASAFAEHGVGKGDVVCLVVPTSIEYAVCYHAALRLGAITSGVNTRFGPAEKESILGRLEPRVIVTEDAGGPPHVTGVRMTLAEVAAAGRGPVDYRRAALVSSDTVAVVWTSGTTSEPKGAVYDHRRLEAMALGAGPMSEPGDRRLYPLPFAHTGYMTRLWDEISNGITEVITPLRWTAREALQLIGRETVTVGQGVPTQWQLMLDHPDFEQTDFSAMRIAGLGAASIPPDLVRRIQREIGCPVIVRYTSTEACVTTSTSPGDPPETVASTVGKPVPGVELRLVDDDGSDTRVGSVGSIRCRSAAVFAGYWKDPEMTAQVLDEDGWLSTGDAGYIDGDGNLSITGRKQDMYIRGGYNIYPLQVEMALSQHAAIADVAVVGLSDPVLGEIGAAFIVPAADADPTSYELEALRSWCADTLADYKLPDRVFVLPELPRNAMSKVVRSALVAMVDSDQAAVTA